MEEIPRKSSIYGGGGRAILCLTQEVLEEYLRVIARLPIELETKSKLVAILQEKRNIELVIPSKHYAVIREDRKTINLLTALWKHRLITSYLEMNIFYESGLTKALPLALLKNFWKLLDHSLEFPLANHPFSRAREFFLLEYFLDFSIL